MDHAFIISELTRNKEVFAQLLGHKAEAAIRWKPAADQWCLLEIVCHLLDEEREDFRARIQHLFEHPDTAPPSFDPLLWVTERKYMEQDYEAKVEAFLQEREQSVQWLQSLENPAWTNSYEHPQGGRPDAEHFLANWLGHDYLHIRQISRINYRYLQEHTHNPLRYAGNW
ncbi:DinB family protein [Catalinimonas niigatensis]|uniref:DinB family protein n=1 Tax=Catalinimonas niigatensis TaxID=1397264 RepID=UPI00266509F9|nr:DinB family protein [Catalinimonas niigatensis]WPP51434.1 DinB family protein [Catalinimonas niigatensis]